MKAKTHSSLKKRIKVTGSGKLKTQKTAKRHLLQNKSTRSKGRGKYGLDVSPSDSKRVRSAMSI